MVLKGRGLSSWGFNNQNYIHRVREYGVNRDGELFVEPEPMNNLITDGIVFVVTKNSRLARVGRILRPDRTDVLRIVPFSRIDQVWDPKFLGALEKRGEEIYMMILPAPAGDDLDPKLWIGLSVPVIPVNHLVAQANPQHQDAQPVVDLPVLDFDGAGRVDQRDLFAWLKAANGLLAGTQGGLSFGNLADSLPGSLAVKHVDYNPGFTRYEQGVFPAICSVRVAGRAGERFVVDVEAQMNRSAGGLFYRRYQGAAEEAVETVEEKGLGDFIRQQLEEVVADVNQSRGIALTVVEDDLGTAVVDKMEVESIKRVCKKGKKLYRIGLKPEEEGGGLNSRVHTGKYESCSFWINIRNNPITQ
jgi:hypothetical protein